MSDAHDSFGNAAIEGSARDRSVRGGGKVLCGQGVSVLIGIAATAVLARLLEPEDFGLLAMVAVLMNLASLFRDAGLGASSVRASHISHETLSGLFWINLLIGVFLSAMVCVLGIVWAK